MEMHMKAGDLLHQQLRLHLLQENGVPAMTRIVSTLCIFYLVTLV